MIKVIKFLFLTLLFIVPIVGFITTPNDHVIKGENRTVNQLPIFNLKNPIYFSNLIAYFNDRMLFKEKVNEYLFPLYKEYFNDFDASLDKYSIYGIKGWIFAGNSLVNVYSQHVEAMTPNWNKIKEQIACFKNLEQEAAKYNAPFYVVVAPDPHGIYSEYLNPYIKSPGKYRLFNKILPLYNENNLTVIDSYDYLRSKKDPNGIKTLYYADDTHWNKYGAYLTFNYVMSKISTNFEPVEHQFKFSKNFNGDLIRNIKNPEKDFLDKAEVIDFNDFLIEIKELNSNKTISTNFLHLNSFANYEFKFINKNAPYSKKLLLISDSYGFSFTPFAVELFEEVIFTTRYGNYFERSMNLINQEKPDLVIYLSGERFFANY